MVSAFIVCLRPSKREKTLIKSKCRNECTCHDRREDKLLDEREYGLPGLARRLVKKHGAWRI